MSAIRLGKKKALVILTVLDRDVVVCSYWVVLNVLLLVTMKRDSINVRLLSICLVCPSAHARTMFGKKQTRKKKEEVNDFFLFFLSYSGR